ncbi:MAG: hypothetical protein L3J46_11770, partial [Kangiellaceae bacterium]|nr:hypothetical protein [Kangiellaceae bacterium]
HSARQGHSVPLPASLYSQIANGFFSLKITKEGPLQWSFHERGQLQTVRFDQPESLVVDWKNSHGILGINKHAGSLYIAFDPAVKVPKLTLSKQGTDLNPNHHPVLQQSRWRIAKLKGDHCNLSFTVTGFGQVELTSQAMKPSASYHIAASRQGKTVWTQDISTDKNGILTFSAKTNAHHPLSMAVSCQ